MAKQGFASMNKERLREVAILGGKRAQQNGKAHKWTPEEARAAQVKGVDNRLKKLGHRLPNEH